MLGFGSPGIRAWPAHPALETFRRRPNYESIFYLHCNPSLNVHMDENSQMFLADVIQHDADFAGFTSFASTQ